MNNWRVRSNSNQNGSQELHHYAVKTQSLNALYHYGVKGMKWGIRRTPEQLGHKRKSSIEGSQKFKYRSSMPNKRTAVSNVAMAVTAASILATYAVPAPQVWAVTVPTILVSSAISSAVNNSVNNLLLDDSEYPDSEKRPLKSLPKKTREMTPEEDCAAINVPLTKGGVNNCSNCILAYDMRRRGYDVSAAKTNTPSYTGKLVDEFYKGKKDVLQSRLSEEEMKKSTMSNSKIFESSIAVSQKKIAETAYNKMIKEAEDHYPVGSRGYINIAYANSNVGHVFNWERDETGVNFYDAQNGKNQKIVMYTFSNALPSYTLTRLDDLTPNSKITTRLNDGEAKKK